MQTSCPLSSFFSYVAFSLSHLLHLMTLSPSLHHHYEGLNPHGNFKSPFEQTLSTISLIILPGVTTIILSLLHHLYPSPCGLTTLVHCSVCVWLIKLVNRILVHYDHDLIDINPCLGMCVFHCSTGQPSNCRKQISWEILLQEKQEI